MGLGLEGDHLNDLGVALYRGALRDQSMGEIPLDIGHVSQQHTAATGLRQKFQSVRLGSSNEMTMCNC